jgi:hypothetical protein
MEIAKTVNEQEKQKLNVYHEQTIETKENEYQIEKEEYKQKIDENLIKTQKDLDIFQQNYNTTSNKLQEVIDINTNLTNTNIDLQNQIKNNNNSSFTALNTEISNLKLNYNRYNSKLKLVNKNLREEKKTNELLQKENEKLKQEISTNNIKAAVADTYQTKCQEHLQKVNQLEKQKEEITLELNKIITEVQDEKINLILQVEQIKREFSSSHDKLSLTITNLNHVYRITE